MKKPLNTLLLLLSLFVLTATAQHTHQHKEGHGKEAPSQAAAKMADGEVVKRGEPLGDAPVVEFADVLKEPQKFAGKTVRIEGVVERVCQKEGCWMQITPTDSAEGSVRVTFDHKFSVPKDAGKMKFRAVGRVDVKTLSKEEVEHLVKDDGAKIKTEPDGTAREVSFVANGVELWK
ncbi:MAG TPA: DUF4920 domain-containing protein [Pyrinomonadaceae bacterium]|nr:DUF4920 domain-containing protein [Pyrinomonadaceae bacterium]